MGVKRFLVAGGMASLVLIGVVLVDDEQSMASTAQASAKNGPGINVGGTNIKVPPCCDTMQERQQAATNLTNRAKGFFDPGGTGEGGGTGGGTTGGTGEGGGTGGTGEGGGTGGGTTGGTGEAGMEQVALGAGGAGGTTGGTDATGGAVAFAATASALPRTGGPSVVFLPTAGPLLLAIALLLGSGLCMAAFVRSGRS